MPKPKITILVGSGASLEFGVSGVARLTEKLNARTRADSYVQHTGADAALDTIIQKLETLYDTPAEANFERIYHTANRLMQHARDPKMAAPEFRPVLHPFIAPLPPALDERKLRVLERAYIKHLFAIIAEESAGADVAEIEVFLDSLMAAYTPRIYSLNYDDLFHRACPRLFTGFGRAAGPNRFDSASFFARRDEPALFHTHGSIHISFAAPPAGDIGELFWFENVAEATRGSDFSGSGSGQADGTFIERSPLITGLEKSASVLAPPFSFYFSEFLRDLMTSDIVVVIGYGLADPHVNAHLSIARSSNDGPRLIVIDYFEWLDEFHLNSFKSAHFSNVLRAPISDDLTVVPMDVSGWRAIKDRRAAVWNLGFRKFLASHPDFSSLAARL